MLKYDVKLDKNKNNIILKHVLTHYYFMFIQFLRHILPLII